MVSFQCDACGDVVTRKKLDNHLQRCRYPCITCIDCHMTFFGDQHKSHTSCMTEAQKYQGAPRKHEKPVSRDKEKNKDKQTPRPPRNGPNSHYQPPSVHDAAATDLTPTAMQLARLDVPPPAPSPPQSQPTPVNVFDFLVSERSPRPSPSSTPSSPISPIRRRISESSISSSESSRPPSRAANAKDNGISYGSEPVARALHKYASDVSLPMDVDSQVSAAAARTPAPRHLRDDKSSARSGSDKKRKRPPVEELDLSDAKNSDDPGDGRAVLHTGLTGGLGKLLSKAEHSKADASPLSPKKRSKHSRDAEAVRVPDDALKKRRSGRHDDADERHKKAKKHRRKAIQAAPAPKAIASGPVLRSSYSSHSEFFLGLVDKDHRSQKGQSIWGALKTFHEGLCDDDELDLYEADGSKQREEKRLLKALRVKRNRDGDIVLFARPDYEMAEEMESIKRIEAAR